MKDEYTRHVKSRKTGEKTWSFVSTGDKTNRLRVHARLFTSAMNAQTFIDLILPDNPGWEFKVQPINRPRYQGK